MVIQVEDNNVPWRDDGVDPTTTEEMILFRVTVASGLMVLHGLT